MYIRIHLVILLLRFSCLSDLFEKISQSLESCFLTMFNVSNWHLECQKMIVRSYCSLLCQRLFDIPPSPNLISFLLQQYHKTKSKVITLTSHNRHKKYNKPIRTWSKYKYLVSSAGSMCKQIAIGFGFMSEWLRKWSNYFEPTTEQSKHKSLSTLTSVKTALLYFWSS